MHVGGKPEGTHKPVVSQSICAEEDGIWGMKEKLMYF